MIAHASPFRSTNAQVHNTPCLSVPGSRSSSSCAPSLRRPVLHVHQAPAPGSCPGFTPPRPCPPPSHSIPEPCRRPIGRRKPPRPTGRSAKDANRRPQTGPPCRGAADRQRWAPPDPAAPERTPIAALCDIPLGMSPRPPVSCRRQRRRIMHTHALHARTRMPERPVQRRQSAPPAPG